MKVNLSEVREQVMAFCGRLQDREGPYGCYRRAIGQRPDLYSTCDIAIMRHVMGEDLTGTVSAADRAAWADHINSFVARYRPDGRYSDTFGHSPLHANGMVVGALGVLGARQVLPVRLYEAFSSEEKVASWLDTEINWSTQWGASHLFWGGMHCFSMSARCTAQWRATVFDWLDAQLDEATGWWRRGVPHADRHQPLGGSVHILPIYQHHGRVFPLPERVIDSVLALQLPNGRWQDRKDDVHVMGYLELDALYAMRYLQSLAPGYRTADIAASVARYADLVRDYWNHQREALLALHPHRVLSATGTFGLLQQFMPDAFPDGQVWTDIFSDIALY